MDSVPFARNGSTNTVFTYRATRITTRSLLMDNRNIFYTLRIRSIQNVAFHFSVGRNPSLEVKLNHAINVS